MASNANHIFEPKIILLFIYNLLLQFHFQLDFPFIVGETDCFLNQAERNKSQLLKAPGGWFLGKFITYTIGVLQIEWNEGQLAGP